MNPKVLGGPSLAIEAADDVLRKKGRSFYWARQLLNEQHAVRATRLYSLCRYLDDLADEAASVERSQAILKEIRCSIFSGQSADPVIRDGLLLMYECGINPRILGELIDGVGSDLTEVAMADLDQLLRYCYQVAGTVGSMMCNVLGVKNPSALPHAIDLGIAMQLTNICRDVREDALAGRRYLPATLLGDLQPKALEYPAVEIQPQLQQCLRHLLEIADSYYRSGESGMSYLPLGARAGILTAARLYEAIGTGIKARQYKYWQGRVVVTPFHKAALTAKVLLTAPVARSFWRPTRRHDVTLHRSLSGLIAIDRKSGGIHEY